MNDIIAKISSYDIFTNLVPGAVLIYMLKYLDVYVLDSGNIAGDLLIYYFAGLVVGRIGSLVIEPLLRSVGFVKYASYRDFVLSSQKDTKIAILLEVNNQYRALLTVMSVVIIAVLGKESSVFQWIDGRNLKLAIISGVALLFLVAFRKQSAFIKSRVEIHREDAH